MIRLRAEYNRTKHVKNVQLMDRTVFSCPFICSTTVISTRYSRSRYSSIRIGAVYWDYYPLYYYQAGFYSRRNNYPSGERLLSKWILDKKSKHHEAISKHYSDVIIGSMMSQITRLTIVYSTVYSDQKKHQSSASLRVTGLCEGNSPMTGEFPSKRASTAENVSIWWRHHVLAGVYDYCDTVWG